MRGHTRTGLRIGAYVASGALALSGAVLAGSPKKPNPSFQRTVAPGRTVVLVTKIRPRVRYVSFLPSSDYFSLVSGGRVNTLTGRHVREIDADDFDEGLRTTAGRRTTTSDAWSLR